MENGMFCHLTWDPTQSNKILLQTQLPTPITNANDYEIAVLEVSLTTNFNNSPHQRWIKVSDSESTAEITLPLRSYEDISDLHDAIRSKIKSAGFDPDIKVEKSQDYSKWTLNSDISVEFSKELGAMLGFSGSLKSESEKVIFRGKPDLYRNFRRVFIQCNITSPSHCIRGSNKAIISSFPIDTTVEMCTEKTNPPNYYRINVNRIEMLELSLLDELAREMTSNEGTAYCLVHIRHCN